MMKLYFDGDMKGDISWTADLELFCELSGLDFYFYDEEGFQFKDYSSDITQVHIYTSQS